MKKILCLFLSLIIIVTLSGCSFKSLFDDLNTPSEVIGEQEGLLGVNNNEIAEIEPINDKQLKNEYLGCYPKINEVQKRIYKIMLTAAEEMTVGFINLGKRGQITQSDISIAYVAMNYDFPEIFWMPKSYIIAETGSAGSKHIAVAFEYTQGNNTSKYLFSKKDRDTKRAELDAAVSKIITEAGRFNSEYEKVKFFNDYICNNTVYNTETRLGYTSYGCLVNNIALCEGYSKAFQLLCKKVGIPCDIITGVSENEGHMWNCVKIDGIWSYTDVTWNDREEKTSYMYFNISKDQILHDHSFAPLFSQINDTNLSDGESFYFSDYDCSSIVNTVYYRENYIATKNYSQIAALIKEKAANGLNNVELMFTDSEIKSIIEKDPEGYLSKIQKYLSKQEIDQYAVERDVLTLIWNQ